MRKRTLNTLTHLNSKVSTAKKTLRISFDLKDIDSFKTNVFCIYLMGQMRFKINIYFVYPTIRLIKNNISHNCLLMKIKMRLKIMKEKEQMRNNFQLITLINILDRSIYLFFKLNRFSLNKNELFIYLFRFVVDYDICVSFLYSLLKWT